METNILSTLCHQLKKQQLDCFKTNYPSYFKDYHLRKENIYSEGLFHFQKILTTYGIEIDEIRENLNLKSLDARFSYIDIIPQAAFCAAARARALELSTFGFVIDDTSELAMLFSIFTNLLDGILDETPEILQEKDINFLHKVMLEQEWVRKNITIELPYDANRHPLVTLLFEIMLATVSKVTHAKNWSKNDNLKNSFSKATYSAFYSESNSTKINKFTEGVSEYEKMKLILQNKSVDWSVIVSLSPLCFHELPDKFDFDKYNTFSKKMGVFGGWLDDIEDLYTDICNNRWSNVSLELSKAATDCGIYSNPYETLTFSLVESNLSRKVIALGHTYFNELVTQVSQDFSYPEPLLFSIADNTQAFLGENNVNK